MPSVTDRWQIEAILTRAGVVWRTTEQEYGVDLEIHQGDSEANKGYGYFFTALEFDNDGKLLAVGAWE